jgi:hypothetical protein
MKLTPQRERRAKRPIGPAPLNVIRRKGIEANL